MVEKKAAKKHLKKNWYQRLLLSQKFKLNVVIGFIALSIGLLVLLLNRQEMSHHWEAKLHAGLGLIAVLTGLWFFGRGLRYESQLDAIRIAKRNRNFGNNYSRRPGKAKGK